MEKLMKLDFRSLATLSAFLFLSLALIWMFAPDLPLSSWGVEFSPEVGLVARRAAALYAGIGVMLFSARNAEPSPSRSALVAGLVVACLTLAALGSFELVAGHANRSILTAVLIEVALVLAFLYVERVPKRQLHSTITQG
ncbi:hypothetical protein A7976_06630 [Methylobacillus sp. MM3]|jgi:hypothetical protein|nr:hypothetical protein A7976_06630 [Methylobacillus sp. MM3]